MKFGKLLKTLAVEAWKKYYVGYNKLKNILKSRNWELEAQQIAAQRQADVKNRKDAIMGLTPFTDVKAALFAIVSPPQGGLSINVEDEHGTAPISVTPLHAARIAAAGRRQSVSSIGAPPSPSDGKLKTLGSGDSVESDHLTDEQKLGTRSRRQVHVDFFNLLEKEVDKAEVWYRRQVRYYDKLLAAARLAFYSRRGLHEVIADLADMSLDAATTAASSAAATRAAQNSAAVAAGAAISRTAPSPLNRLVMAGSAPSPLNRLVVAGSVPASPLNRPAISTSVTKTPTLTASIPVASKTSLVVPSGSSAFTKVVPPTAAATDRRSQVAAIRTTAQHMAHDLLLLKSFVEVNRTAVRKILKKHDKVTGVLTKDAVLRSLHANRSFFPATALQRLMADAERFNAEVSKYMVFSAAIL